MRRLLLAGAHRPSASALAYQAGRGRVEGDRLPVRIDRLGELPRFLSPSPLACHVSARGLIRGPGRSRGAPRMTARALRRSPLLCTPGHGPDRERWPFEEIEGLLEPAERLEAIPFVDEGRNVVQVEIQGGRRT